MAQHRLAAPAVVLSLLLVSSFARTSLSSASTHQETFSEEVVVYPLFDGRVLVHFQFSFSAPYKRHYTVFPLSVGQLVSAVPFDEVELSLTSGRWHHHRWDQPLTPVKPAGAELRAEFSPQVPQTALPHLWSTISHALGGLFCASLHFVARPESTAVQAITAEPLTLLTQNNTIQNNTSDSYNRVNDRVNDRVDDHKEEDSEGFGSQQKGFGSSGSAFWRPVAAENHVLSAALPQEASCTENLTPWLKLLPCRDAAGLAGLLKRRDVIFGAEYHSLRVLLKVQRDNNLKPLHSTLTQTLTLVLDPSSSSSSSSSSGRYQQSPRVGSASTLSDIDLNSILGTKLGSSCPVAEISRVYLLLPGQETVPDHQQLLLLPPRQCAGTAAVDADGGGATTYSAAAAATGGDGGEVGVDSQHADHPTAAAAAGKLNSCNKLAGWTVNFGPSSITDVITGFKVSPVPDLVAILAQPQQEQQTNPFAGMSSSLGSGAVASELGKDSSSSSSGSSSSGSSSKQRVMYGYDLHAAAAETLSNNSRKVRSSDTAAETASTAELDSDRPVQATGRILPLTLTWLSDSSSSSSSTKSTSSTSSSGQQESSKAQSPQSSDDHVNPSANPFGRVAPPYVVRRYTVSSGQFHGGLVLELHATGEPAAVAAAVGDVGVCILQVVPWYVRLWLHTLQLTIDGQVSPLSQHLLLRHISTAQDRARPLVLNLCLSLPASARTISLSAKFSKAFLTAFEHPPDAHRGFDVPAAKITYLGPVVTAKLGGKVVERLLQEGLKTGSLLEGFGRWRVLYGDDVTSVHSAEDNVAGKEEEAQGGETMDLAHVQTSLMASLAELRPQQVYSPGVIVQLAVPDFSMPYNVICLTSTVLAVFFGATLNTLLLRPGTEQRMLAAGKYASKAAKRKRKLKLLLVIVIFGGLAVYIDPAVQEAVVEQLRGLGFLSEAGPEAHVPAAHRDPLHIVT